jgi:hypothetical protein
MESDRNRFGRAFFRSLLGQLAVTFRHTLEFELNLRSDHTHFQARIFNS